jgi:protocatechuate 3,4-dioxygenase beta subunit
MSGIILPRRGFLRAGLLALPALTPGGVRAANLPPTPPQTEGPFYPDELPRDTDSDLVRVTGADAQALGRVAHVLGRVVDRHGRPLPGLPVEVWQCDAHGRYLARGDAAWFGRRPARDPGFQGYGRTLTDAGGGYRFRTIRPVAYPGRTPHIHFKVRGAKGNELLTTQMYVAGEPGNARDGIYGEVGPDERERVTVALREAPEIEGGALAGTFEIVVAA